MLRQSSSLFQLFGSPPAQFVYVKFLPVTLDTNVPSVTASVPSIYTKFDVSTKQDSAFKPVQHVCPVFLTDVTTIVDTHKLKDTTVTLKSYCGVIDVENF